MYESHDVRHVDFRGLTVVNETPRFWGVTILHGNEDLMVALPLGNLEQLSNMLQTGLLDLAN